MKLSINWLKSYIDPKLTTEALAQRLVMAGWDVEAVETVGKDTVLELEITPNRPDCLNVWGLAREVAAITGKKVSFPKYRNYKATNDVPITIQDRKDCSRYVGTLIKDVSIAESSGEIKERLNSVGIRPINNAVDMTNFVLMETGQPLHVFDYDKLMGGKIIVRRAKQGEKITTIDGIERVLDTSVLVIADARRPVAIAGIMGGKDTEVTSSTKNILLESAHFDRALVRRCSRQLGLRSESSYRFERNVDWQGVLTGANRATDLLLESTKGRLAGRTDKAYLPNKGSSLPIKISAEEVEILLGAKIPTPRIKSILTALEFKISGNGSLLTVTSPSFRQDIKVSADLIEEIARMIGYDRLPRSLPQVKAQNLAVESRMVQVKRTIRDILRACGVDEAVTLAMTNTKDMAKCCLQPYVSASVKVFNPLSSDQELMRLNLVPSLLQVALTNMNRGQKELRLFELAKRYQQDGERDTLGILLTGRRYTDWRLNKKEMVEFSDLKGVLETILQTLKVEVSLEVSSNSVFDSSCAAEIVFNGKTIGGLGRINPQVLDNWDIKTHEVYFAGVDLGEISKLPQPILKYQPSSEFPAIVRDVSIAVKREVSYRSIEEICQAQGGHILQEVKFIEQYIGDKVPAGQKALVFSLIYQSRQRTLREEEVNATHEGIVQALLQQLQASRR